MRTKRRRKKSIQLQISKSDLDDLSSLQSFALAQCYDVYGYSENDEIEATIQFIENAPENPARAKLSFSKNEHGIERSDINLVVKNSTEELKKFNQEYKTFSVTCDKPYHKWKSFRVEIISTEKEELEFSLTGDSIERLIIIKNKGQSHSIGKEGVFMRRFFEISKGAFFKMSIIESTIAFDLPELFYSSFDHSKRLIVSFTTLKTRVKKLR